MNDFLATDVVRDAWATFKERSGFLMFATLVVMVWGGLIGAVSFQLTAFNTASIFGFPILLVSGTLLGMGITAFFLQAHDAIRSVHLGELWHPRPFFFYLGVRILTGVAVVLGLVLLIVPGIMLALMFLFGSFIVIDRGLDPIEAMKESMHITLGYRFELLFLLLLLLGINILGVVALGVGLLVSIPVSMLALVHAYRTLALKAKTPSVL